MTLRIWLIALAILLFAGLAGCGGEPQSAAPPATRAPTAVNLTTPVLPVPTAVDKLRSDKGSAVSTVGPVDLDELVRGNNAFAFDLYQALSGGEGNLFYSPFSISQALTMTSAGARGETLRQMEATLHHRLPQSELHPAFNALERPCFKREGARGYAQRRWRCRTVFPPERRQRNMGSGGLSIPARISRRVGCKLRGWDDGRGLRGRAGRGSRQDQRLGR